MTLNAAYGNTSAEGPILDCRPVLNFPSASVHLLPSTRDSHQCQYLENT